MIRRFLVLCVLLAVFHGLQPALAHSIKGYAKVIDGDTLEINGNVIRLIGIDAPEGAQWCYDSQNIEYRCGVMATAWLLNATTGKQVRCKWSKTDTYKRLLGTCFIGERNLGAGIVKAGWSVAYRKYSAAYISDENAAREAERGLWSGTFQMPWDWRAKKPKKFLSNSAKIKKPKQSMAGNCCKICRKSKACGNACIRQTYTCRKAPGCACNAR